MLRYIVDETLDGRASGIKAVSIAMAVFGRDSSFDQQSDPVVRLEARSLRRDLDNYYATAGRDDPIRIDIPKGRYIPTFTPIAASVSQAPAVAPAAPGVDEDTGGGAGPRGRRIGPVLWLVAPVLLLAVAVAAYLGWSGQRNEPVSDLPRNGVPIVLEAFHVGDGEPGDTYLSEGITYAVFDNLSKFSEFRLSLLSEAASLSPRMLEEIRGAAKYVLKGSVASGDGVIRVRADLVRPSDGRIMWSGQFVEPKRTDGLFEVENQIAGRVATAIGQEYGIIKNEQLSDAIKSGEDPNLNSYACVARALIFRRTHREEEYQAARDCLELAVVRDSDYAQAWAMLAFLRFDAARYGYDSFDVGEDAYLPAREAAETARSLDPRNIEAVKALSVIEQYVGNFDRAIALAREAVALNPNAPDALANLGYRLSMRNRFDEGVPLLKAAIARSIVPVPFFYHMIAMDHMMRGEWAKMLEAAESAVADGSSISYCLLAIAHGGLGNDAEAADNLRKMAERWPLLAEDPRAALELHKLDPAVIEVVLEGLARAGWVAPER